MTPDPEFVALLNTIDDTRAKLRKLSAEQPENWKVDYARLRPVFQEQTSRAIGMTLSWLRKKGDPALIKQYEEMVAHASAKLASHQARYPVLALDANNPDYVASMREVNENFDGILRFVRATLR